MDLATISQTAQWACNELAAFWITPPGNLTIGVTANAVYGLLKRSLLRPAASGALEEAKAGPMDEDNLKALKLQIEKQLKEDQAFADELLKLVPREVQSNWNLHQNVIGSGNIATGYTGGNVDIKL